MHVGGKIPVVKLFEGMLGISGPTTLRGMICNVTDFPLIFLHRSAYCHFAISNCCPDLGPSRGYKGIGLQPETLENQLLVKHSHTESKIETNSDKT
eukprot:1139421-Pelagomonas_calceolata.AAC.2